MKSLKEVGSSHVTSIKGVGSSHVASIIQQVLAFLIKDLQDQGVRQPLNLDETLPNRLLTLRDGKGRCMGDSLQGLYALLTLFISTKRL